MSALLLHYERGTKAISVLRFLAGDVAKACWPADSSVASYAVTLNNTATAFERSTTSSEVTHVLLEVGQHMFGVKASIDASRPFFTADVFKKGVCA